jgi:Ca2+-binding RTX toxin-like protein
MCGRRLRKEDHDATFSEAARRNGAPVSALLGGDCSYRLVMGRPLAGGPRCTIRGDAGDNRLVGTNGRDVICGSRGGDDIIEERGNDVLIGGLGEDDLWGREGNDALRGGPGQDDLEGGKGRDWLKGGAQWEECEGGPGADRRGNCEARDTDRD